MSKTEYLARLELPSTWADTMRGWNDFHSLDHPWHYTQASNFSRDFMRGRQAIADTKYDLSGVPGQPMTTAEALASVEEMIERWSRAAERGAKFVPVDEETARAVFRGRTYRSPSTTDEGENGADRGPTD